MTSIIQKNLVKAEYLKIPLNLFLEKKYNKVFINLDLTPVGNEIVLTVNFLKPRYRTTMRPEVIVKQCLNWFKAYKLNQTFKIRVEVNMLEGCPVDSTKNYLNLLTQKIRRGNVFLALSKLEAMPMPEDLTGLAIRVKGKRGDRKTRKKLVWGNPCNHALGCQSGLFVRRTYHLGTDLGIFGVEITLIKKHK